jgi:enoyl-CoA hydratase/carnithine racemase
MQHIQCERTGVLLAVKLRRGKANALNASMVEELNVAVEDATRDDQIRGVVLASDAPNFFCGGFDINEVFHYDRETMTLFFARFIDLYETLHLLPKPVVAAVSGHAVAGGAILALSCDTRILARGPYRFALNEINLGVVLPPGIIRMVLGAVSQGIARDLLLSGDAISPERALEAGIAREIVEPAAVQERALAVCFDLANKPQKAFAAFKQTLRDLAGHSSSGGDRNALESFINQWFSDESRSRRKVLVADLSAKSEHAS